MLYFDLALKLRLYRGAITIMKSEGPKVKPKSSRRIQEMQRKTIIIWR